MKLNPIFLGAVCLTFSILRASAATLYVDLNSTNPVSPYAGWSTAATNIQAAIDASSAGDQILVTNGVYQTGGRVVYGSLTNRVVINKAITVQSINGPSVTLIQGNSVPGSNAVRCVFMTNNSVLSGFTLTNGGTLSSGDYFLDECGGGVWTTNNSTAVVSNCVLIGNHAQNIGGGAYNGNIYNSSIIQNSAYDGGGVGCQGTFVMVTNSLIVSNSAIAYGGGAWGATLKNCKIFKNTAQSGGGAEGSELYGCLVVSNTATQTGGGLYIPMSAVNCTIIGNTSFIGAGGISMGGAFIYNSIIYYNTVTTGGSPNYDSPGFVLFNCCTTPLPQNNINSITNDPAFIDCANGDFHLQSNSPCINGGFSYSANVATDLDGNPRIVDGFVDIGAYEYQTPGFILPYYWAQQYGLSLDGSIDSDGDGMNNRQEVIAGTNPTNAASVLKMLSVSNSISGIIVKWQSVSNKVYYLQRSTNLLAHPAFISIYTNFPAPVTTLSFTDKTATNGSSFFYRVSVQ